MSENVSDFGPPEPVAQADEFGPPEPVTAAKDPRAPVSFTAYRAARGPTPDRAAQALRLAGPRGVSPQWAADNADGLQQTDDEAEFASALGVSPVLRSYAEKGPVPGALAKEDVTV